MAKDINNNEDQPITADTLRESVSQTRVKPSKRRVPQGRQIVQLDVSSWVNGRQKQYYVTVDAEDYSDAPSQTVPNASMTIEAIYKRIAQGKPIVDNPFQGLQSERNLGYDGQMRDSEASLDEAWENPYTSPCGTLDRVEEEAQRANQIAQRQSSAQAGSKQEQKTQPATEEPTGSAKQEPTGSAT